MFKWLLVQWPYATFFAAFFLAALFPPIERGLGLPLALVFAQLPIYMFHQLEEHYHDRFRAFINLHIGKGQEALTPEATFWINSLGVWGCDLVAFYLAIYVNPALGLIAVYLALFNGVTHIIAALALRCYNPGLVTAVVALIPFGLWSAFVISDASHAGWPAHLLAFAVALAIHAAIMVTLKLHLRKLNAVAKG
jgi:hypothetical protein